MTNRHAPRRPAGLSGQEEEALRTLEKGYDPDGGALPDPELPVHDHRDRKPGDGAVDAPDDEAGKSRQTGVARPAGAAGGRREESASRGALGDAEKKGLLPSGSVAAPPMDRPEDTSAGPANLDPDTARRRP
ncbi:hypothetical protein [Bordetella genomosp. 11]|uniref:Uncharacterized protein n=1 Tax=Bordetella genomosp. 11 TaxID=1416808 RepID=A0A261V0Y1_9BORD|nr:hypothetical protein [Bordetella genomosp. 11]OZI67180.1 hypothetical protein CAL28_05705 [Bordetella genomosp. 11]